jgi:hypothetical protein
MRRVAQFVDNERFDGCDGHCDGDDDGRLNSVADSAARAALGG